MSPTPTSFNHPAAPASYAWEATDEAVAARYGLPIEAVERFDLNTSPQAPAWLSDVLASGRFQLPLNDYPPGDYRLLAEAAARQYAVDPAEIVVAAGADEALDLVAKAVLRPGGRAVLPVPTYAMYRVLTEQRGAEVVPVARLGAADGYVLDVDALVTASRSADLVWLCDPNNPTGRLEPDGAIEDLLRRIATEAAADGREGPVVVLDEAYGEFVGRERVTRLDAYPRLVVIRTVSKAFALASFRVGFAVARGALRDRIALFRPPGSVTTVSATVATAALERPAEMRANVDRILAERDRLATALAEAGWKVVPAGPGATNFLLVDLGSPEAAGALAEAMLRRGLVPRTFAAGHPLAGHLRITVRSPSSNARLEALARGARDQEDPA